MLETKEFKAWHKLECARRMRKKSVDQIVDEQLQPENLKVEERTDEGWRKMPGNHFPGVDEFGGSEYGD